MWDQPTSNTAYKLDNRAITNNQPTLGGLGVNNSIFDSNKQNAPASGSGGLNYSVSVDKVTMQNEISAGNVILITNVSGYYLYVYL